MNKPIITGIPQIGIVVKDLDATVKTYADKYGIGPWYYFNVDETNTVDFINDGKEKSYSCRVACARIGGMELELIEPLDNDSRHARFLREKGEGVEHIALAFENYGETKQFLTDRGLEVTTAGTVWDTRYEFFNSQDDLKVDVEIQEWPFDKPYPTPIKVYPPEG